MSGSHVETPLAAKKISKEYRDNWDTIFGKKEPKKKLPPEPGQTPVMDEVPEDEVVNPNQKVKKAASKVLKDPTKSKKAKTERGEGLASAPKKKTSLSERKNPKWGDPTIGME